MKSLTAYRTDYSTGKTTRLKQSNCIEVVVGNSVIRLSNENDRLGIMGLTGVLIINAEVANKVNITTDESYPMAKRGRLTRAKKKRGKKVKSS